MASTRTPPLTGGDSDRLARVVAMVNDAVALLNSAVDEIKGDREHGDDDDGNAARPPDRDLE